MTRWPGTSSLQDREGEGGLRAGWTRTAPRSPGLSPSCAGSTSSFLPVSCLPPAASRHVRDSVFRAGQRVPCGLHRRPQASELARAGEKRAADRAAHWPGARGSALHSQDHGGATRAPPSSPPTRSPRPWASGDGAGVCHLARPGLSSPWTLAPGAPEARLPAPPHQAVSAPGPGLRRRRAARGRG